MITLQPDDYTWKIAKDGQLPECADLTQPGFGIGRIKINGNTVVGKIELSRNVMYVPWQGREVYFQNYEALARTSC